MSVFQLMILLLKRSPNLGMAFVHIRVNFFPNPFSGVFLTLIIARNNLRAMKKGDLAFFYHSNCKVPAIVGTMEIVEEHTPDRTPSSLCYPLFIANISCTVTAHDPSAPYYDANSKPSDPKWSVVHVTFRQKLKTPITLKELKEWQGTKGHPLENMQMLKLARISVSKVSTGEWEFLTKEMGERGDIVQ
jgi:predicted RNA-binding protein with PUA-like domain